MKNDLVHLAIRSALSLADRLRPNLLIALGRALGVLACAVCPQARRHAIAQASLGLSPLSAPRLARASFRHAGESLALSLLLRRQSTSALQWVEVTESCRNLMDGLLARGHGVVFVTPHLGPFELIAAAFAELGYTPAVVVRESYDPRLDPLVDAHRTGRGVQVIHRGRLTAPGMIIKALRAGRPVGFLPDLSGRVRRANVHLLGCRSELAIGPVALSLRTGAPLLVGYLAPRTSGRLETPTDGQPFFSLEAVAVPNVGDPESGSQKVADILSHAIGRAPERWLWMAARLQVMART